LSGTTTEVAIGQNRSRKSAQCASGLVAHATKHLVANEVEANADAT